VFSSKILQMHNRLEIVPVDGTPCTIPPHNSKRNRFCTRAYAAHTSLEELCKVLSDHIISHSLRPPHSYDLTCDFYLWGSLRVKVCKTNTCTLEEPRNKILSKILEIVRKNSTGLTPACSAGTPSVFSQEGNIFSICCSSGEFLLHFLEVILTAIASL
jgi:hypothetical protein